MSVIALILAWLAVMALAIPFSMVGQGGGSTYVPILLMAGMAMHEASTTSLFMIMIASISAMLVFGRKRTIDWKLLFSIVPIAILGSFAGGYVAQWVSAPVLKVIFAVVLTMAAFFMLRPAAEGRSPKFVPRWGLWNRTCGGYQYRISMGVLIPAIGLAAFIAGMIGVGGGLFVLPMLILLFACPTRIAIGVSTAYVGITALPGFVGHILGGDPFHVWRALCLAVAAFAGARIGPIVSLRTSVSRLRVILAVVLVALAVWMVVALVM